MVKKAFSYIISFLLVIALFVIVVTGMVSSTILNKGYVIREINESDYYEKLSETINDKFRNYIMQSGMDEVIFEGLFTRETLQKDFNRVLDAVYDEKELSIDTEKIRNKLNDNIEKYAKENNINITETNRNQITAFENTIVENYVESIKYSNTGIKAFTKVIKVMNDIIYNGMAVTITLTIVMIITLALINKDEKNRVLSYLSITLLALGGFIIVFLIYEKINLNIEESIIQDRNLSILIRLFVNKIINRLYIISGISIGSGIILTVINKGNVNWIVKKSGNATFFFFKKIFYLIYVLNKVESCNKIISLVKLW